MTANAPANNAPANNAPANDTHDIGMCVGVESYPWPNDFSEEVRAQGLSKAIPPGAIPPVVSGETHIACVHPRAIVRVTAKGRCLMNLGEELVREYVEGTLLEPPPENKAEMMDRWLGAADWRDAYCFDKLVTEEGANTLHLCYLLREADRAGDLDRLQEKYGIEYTLGWFGYTWLTGVQYVLRDDEDGLPPELAGTGAEPVRAVYDGDA